MQGRCQRLLTHPRSYQGRRAHQLGENFTCTTSGVPAVQNPKVTPSKNGDAAAKSQNTGDALHFIFLDGGWRALLARTGRNFQPDREMSGACHAFVASPRTNLTGLLH